MRLIIDIAEIMRQSISIIAAMAVAPGMAMARRSSSLPTNHLQVSDWSKSEGIVDGLLHMAGWCVGSMAFCLLPCEEDLLFKHI